MSHKLIIKDATRQIAGRIISALCGFIVLKIITPYLGPLRYGDYSTILKYFAIRSALADFGLYIIAVKKLGIIKAKETEQSLQKIFGKFVGTRVLIMTIVYITALSIAYMLPTYHQNIYLLWGLPIGALFSASFMTAGILQLPLQLFWKMEKVSIALILARLSQLIMLVITVFIIFPGIAFDQSPNAIIGFSLIIGSVLLSGIVQAIYVKKTSDKILPLKINFDINFTKNILKENRKYGLSYYLSSFHTLIVLIFLSIMFPTTQGFTYTGIWALGLALIEILLIIPSALGNSILHNVGNYNLKDKLKSFGSLATLMFWIGAIVFANFLLFKTQIINIIGGQTYIGTGLTNPGSNTILPYLAIVVRMSFIKQVFNYIFVATENHNQLLKINSIGVVIGILIGIFLIPKYHILGGIITQISLEVIFLLGAIFIGYHKKVLPIISRKKIPIILLIVGGVTATTYYIIDISSLSTTTFIGTALLFNAIIVAFSWKILKKIARGLSNL